VNAVAEEILTGEIVKDKLQKLEDKQRLELELN